MKVCTSLTLFCVQCCVYCAVQGIAVQHNAVQFCAVHRSGCSLRAQGHLRGSKRSLALSRSHPAFPGADTLSVLMTLCCANKGERAVVLALATLFKTVATMPSTTAWVQSHEGERALQRILRHLSDTSFAPDAMALRRVLVHLLSNLAAVGGSV